MKSGKLSSGQFLLLLLFSAAGVLIIGLGFVLLARPVSLAAALPPTITTVLPIRLPSPTPFQPLPVQSPIPTATRIPTPVPISAPSPLPQEASPEPVQNTWPPASARIDNIIGFPQSYALSCESRSAVDWAHFFGVEIGETEFLVKLPLSDNPDKGFVGFYNDYGGQVPPYSYGVHADPVADLLKEYGLPADAVKGMTLDELRSEIASGRPVIVWIIFGISNGYALEYTASDGQNLLVAPNEHTAIVIGYDEFSITVLDGAWVYQRSIEQFLNSWGVLENMAVIYKD